MNKMSNFCEYCGAKITNPDAKFCFNCGKPLHDANESETKPENIQNQKNIETKNYSNKLTPAQRNRIKEKQNKIQNNKPIIPNTHNFIANLSDGENFPLPAINNPPIMLKKGEEAYLILQGITLREPRAVRTSTGAYAGPTIHVMKGVSFRVGGAQGQSQSHDEITDIDQGKIILTNKRLVFTGSKKTLNIDLRKIINITEMDDGIELQRENNQKPEYFIGTTQTTISYKENGKRENLKISGYILKLAIKGLASIL